MDRQLAEERSPGQVMITLNRPQLATIGTAPLQSQVRAGLPLDDKLLQVFGLGQA
jgi:hypothetical protein